MDISGHWKGFYEQGGARHGIAMQVAQRGQSFVGRMADETTLLMSRLSDADHELLQRVIREPLAAPPDLLTSLPEHSTVEGEVLGDVVRFDKRYLGTQLRGLWTIPSLDQDDAPEQGAFELLRL